MTGAGTAADPYVIWDVNDLQDIALDLAAYYELGQDIDASATGGWNAGAGFEPIAPFTGSFVGNGHAISGLYIDRVSSAAGALNIGLFGTLDDATVRNVRILGAYMKGQHQLSGQTCNGGVLAAFAVGNTLRIQQVGVTGTLTLAAAAKGAAPYQHSYGGGLIGQLSASAPSVVERCAALVNVSGSASSYALYTTGGLIGQQHGSVVTRNIYARGAVHTTSGHPSASAGGLIGMTSELTYIQKGYATGVVTRTGTATAGGLIARNVGLAPSITDCFWDTQTSGQATSAGGTGKTTAEMKNILTFTDIATVGLGDPWDFVTIWDIDGYWNDGYPFLRWEGPPLIHVTVPNGGEVWDAGSTYTILWTHSTCLDPNTHVIIELLKGGVLDETISAGTPIGPRGGGNYNWTIGSGKTPGPDYRVRVTGVTYPYTDTSDDDFKIRGPIVPSPAPVVTTLPATGVG